MSAAALTKKLLSIDFLANEANLANCLKTILQEFIATRNPIFPRQVNFSTVRIKFLPVAKDYHYF